MIRSQTIDRRYQIISPLGEGLGGEIFRAQGPEGLVALKLLKTEVVGLQEEDRITTFKFEFSLLKGLQHPNVVKIFDFGFDEDSKSFYFTEELIEGSKLTSWGQGKDIHALQKIFLQALQGLAYLHSQKVLHGDLKPENLLVAADQKKEAELKIIDFGLSHPGWSGWAGTPPYLPPEKILNEKVGPASDLYSLGVVFYEALTGENPFLRKELGDTIRAQLHFTPPAATIQRPDLDPVWSELISLMLQKNPRYRIASAESALQFLESRGQIKTNLVKLTEIPNVWIGRQAITEQTRQFLSDRMQNTQNKILLLSGNPELGGENLLTELKYEAELKGFEVVPFLENPEKKPAISFLSTQEIQSKGGGKNLALQLQNKSLVIALTSQEEKTLGEFLPENCTRIELKALALKEVEEYLQEITRNKKIPKPLLNSLYRFSEGYPQQLREALTHLLKDPLIVDASGKWNLAVFDEHEPSLEQLGLSEDSLNRALHSPLVHEPKERWRLELNRAEALAKENRMEESLKLLNRLDGEIARIFDSASRLTSRSQVMEKRGWIYTKQNRLEEAREAFRSALSLLDESEEPHTANRLRLKNFLAFISLLEGRAKEACSQFEETAQAARILPVSEQRTITNNELGQAYLAQGQNLKAIERLQEDLGLFSTLPNPSFAMKANYNLGEAYSREKNFPKAREAYSRVAEIARVERDWDYLIRAYNGMGNLANIQKDYLASLDYYQRSLSLAEYLRDYLCAATVAQNRGVILYENDRLIEALHDLDLSKRFLGKVNPSSHTRYLMARATLELGEVHLRKKELQIAENYFTEALNRSEEDPNLKSFSFYPLAALANLSLQQNNFDKFRELYPKLIFLAQNEEEKSILANLLKKAPNDPREGQEKNLGVAEKPGDSSLILAKTFPQDLLSQILRINRALITEHEPRNLFIKILQYATELSGAESSILIEIGETGEMEVVEAFNTDVDKGQKEISQQVASRVLTSGESIVTRDAQVDQGFNQFQSVVSLHLRSIACIPVRVHQKVIGLLYLTHRYKTDLFSPMMVNALEAFGDQAGLALQNNRYLRQLHARNRELFEKLEYAEDEIDRLKSDLRTKVKNPYPKILGKSRALVEILRLMDRISDTNLSILILGETGSGKELVARSIHENSRRKRGPFVAVNCGAIPENLIESELFGHRAGSFTGAVRDKKGLVEEAHEGTLFLDEIAELPLNTQVKLLRTLQEKEVQRIGDTRPTAVDLRVISATHQSLDQWVPQGKFREDLYYRVAQMVLPVPPLRDRREDLLLLSEHFLEQSLDEIHATKAPRLGRDLLSLMMQYDWPGNIRELENFLRTAAAFAERGVIHCGTLPEFLAKKLEKKGTPFPTPLPQKEIPKALPPSVDSKDSVTPPHTWEDFEEILFSKALLKQEMNCEKAAEDLGVGVATVYVKMRKYGLKNKAHRWENFSLPFGEDLNLANFKQKLIETVYEQTEKSPYAVAKQLGINVGTVYRHLKTSE